MPNGDEWHLLEGENEEDDGSLKRWRWWFWLEEGESSWVLVRAHIVVFGSYLQKSKDVIFEELSEEALVMVVV